MNKMLGLTVASVEGKVGDDKLRLTFTDGRSVLFYHEQDCCESVSIEDISGHWDDIIGYPITLAEESTNREADGFDSNTWTFYRIGTVRGVVVIRWWGSSNGYYSESVDIKWSE